MNLIKLFILCMCLSACGSENTASTETNESRSLTRVRWIWTEYLPADQTLPSVQVGDELNAEDYQITFNESEGYSGSDGCNGFVGSWSEVGNSIVLADKLLTGRFCPDSLTGIRQKFVLSTGVEMPYSIDSGELVLTLTDNSKLVFSNSALG